MIDVESCDEFKSANAGFVPGCGWIARRAMELVAASTRDTCHEMEQRCPAGHRCPRSRQERQGIAGAGTAIEIETSWGRNRGPAVDFRHRPRLENGVTRGFAPDTGVPRDPNRLMQNNRNQQLPLADAPPYALRFTDRPQLRPGLRLMPGEGLAMFDDRAGVAIDINETAVEILRRCDGSYSLEQIVGDLQALFVGGSADEIHQGVRQFLEDAFRRGWVVCG